MKIVVINCTGETYTQGSSGAIATWVRQITTALRQVGHDTVTLAKRTDAAEDLVDADYLDYPGVPHLRGSARVTHLWRRFRGYHHVRQPTWQRRVLQYLECCGADAVVLHNDPEMAGWLAVRLPRVSVMHLFHNENYVARPHRGKYRRADISSFAVSGFTARWVESHIGMRAGSVRVLNPGIDMGSFPLVSRRSKVAVPEVIFVGLLNENKSPHTLLDAAELLHQSGTTIAVKIAGASRYGGPELTTTYEQHLHDRAQHLRRRGVDVRFLGYVGRDQLPEILGHCDIGVVTSRKKESFGLVALEMLAAGLPIVVAETGGLPEVAGEVGRVFVPGDPASLACQLRLTIDQQAVGDDLRGKARRRAASFTWSAAAQALAAVACGQPHAVGARRTRPRSDRGFRLFQ